MHLLRTLAATSLLTVATSAAHSQVYFHDTGTYTFNGLNNSYTTGSLTAGTSPDFEIQLPALVATTPITVRFVISNLVAPNGAHGSYLTLFDNSSNYNVTGSYYALSQNFANGTFQMSATPTGATQLVAFGPNSWSYLDSVTISDICIFSGASCTSGPSSADTTASLQALAASLKTPFALIRAAAESALAYDCDRFDAKNLCFTAIGRRVTGNGIDANESAAAVMLVYKLSPHWRLGGYVDQGSTSSTANLRVASDMPLVGVNAIWNARPDGEGLEVRGDLAYRRQSLDLTRSVIGTAEAGSGSSALSSTLASVTAFYNRRLSDTWSIAPYAGLRHYQGQLDGYTEATSGTVSSPLSYANVTQRNLTASLGVRTTGYFGKTRGTASVGLERDLSSQFDALATTGVAGVNPVAFDGYDRHATRAVASLGLSREIGERQSVGLTALYRQDAFRDTATTAVFVQYRVGF